MIDDKAIYEGPAIAIPRVGEAIHHDGQLVPIEAVAWDFAGTDGVVSVTLVVGDRPYTF
jgi:hypothetical protein